MTKQTLSDQFFNTAQKFHHARHVYEAERANMKALEAELLKYTDEYQALTDKAEYVGEGTWRIFGGTFSAIK